MSCLITLLCGMLCLTSALQAEAPSEITLRPLDWSGVERLVRQQRGKVVVVNIWTTTCGTCVEEFPKLVELHRQLGPKGVACIAVNCDYDGVKSKPPAHYEPTVRAFLKKQQATFENVLLTVPLSDFLEQQHLGSTPAILVYDRTGKLVKRFDADDGREFTMADVRKTVERLLAGEGA